MSVYLVGRLEIHDRDEYRQYEAGFMEIFSRYRGRLLNIHPSLLPARKFQAMVGFLSASGMKIERGLLILRAISASMDFRFSLRPVPRPP